MRFKTCRCAETCRSRGLTWRPDCPPGTRTGPRPRLRSERALTEDREPGARTGPRFPGKRRRAALRGPRQTGLAWGTLPNTPLPPASDEKQARGGRRARRPRERPSRRDRDRSCGITHSARTGGGRRANTHASAGSRPARDPFGGTAFPTRAQPARLPPRSDIALPPTASALDGKQEMK